MLVVITITFMICWMPWGLHQLINLSPCIVSSLIPSSFNIVINIIIIIIINSSILLLLLTLLVSISIIINYY